MKTPERKLRIVIPYTEGLFDFPNGYFASIAGALSEAASDVAEVVVRHESELLRTDDYDVIFFLRRTGLDPTIFDQCLTGEKRIVYRAIDLHHFHWRVPYPPPKLVQIFDRADLIFTTSLHHFHLWKSYRQFGGKTVWVPWSVPDSIFECSQPWEARNNRILVSGSCGPSYPLRRRLFRYAHDSKQGLVDALDYRAYGSGSEKRGPTGGAYHKLLGSYRGAIATAPSTRWPWGRRRIDYTVLKYFEIPACGCLPFMEDTPDLEELGFREGEHYVSINRWNYKKRLGAIHSAEAESMAQAAQELVRRRHTHSRRVNMMLNEIVRRFGRDRPLRERA